MSEIKDKIEVKGLIVSRIPSWAKSEIKRMSKELFSDDYGMTLSYLLICYKEYMALKEPYLNFLKENKNG